MIRISCNTAALGAGLLGAIIVSSAALAQQTQPGASRFTMHPVEGGVLRLDTQNGTMSLCKDGGGQWSCTALPDERAAMEREIDRLATENNGLKESLRKLEEVAGLPEANGKPGAKSPGLQLPTEDDVDKAMSYVQRMLKKFKDKLKEFEDLDGRQTQRL